MSAGATVERDGRLRLFCALRLPDEVVASLVSWQQEALVHEGVRVLQRDHLHVTVAFLGSRPASEVDAIADAVRGAARSARVPLFRIRAYRETSRVAMLVLREELVPGDAYAGRANELAGDLMLRLERLGVYERERRAWMPHVTVARFRAPPKLSPEPPDVAPFSPSEVALYSSVLRSTGSQYEVLESCSLGVFHRDWEVRRMRR
ncbi:MAG TPA: RNA 2',3'-cyclic phosphodiesterase [Gaiellaceae bacterium]|nr:RNA 2',3'-cyclic phosphodiesterase [Gaiellaceae bacterium]